MSQHLWSIETLLNEHKFIVFRLFTEYQVLEQMLQMESSRVTPQLPHTHTNTTNASINWHIPRICGMTWLKPYVTLHMVCGPVRGHWEIR